MRALTPLLFVIALLTCSGESRAEFPQLGEVNGGRAHIVVRGEVSKAKQQEMVKLVGAIVADVEKRFTQKAKTRDPEVTLLLFANADRYREVAESYGPLISDWGFYLPDKRVAIANVDASIGNLRHELVHPLIGDDYPDIPTWLNEGVASLYGSATLGKHGFTFLVNYRLRDCSAHSPTARAPRSPSSPHRPTPTSTASARWSTTHCRATCCSMPIARARSPRSTPSCAAPSATSTPRSSHAMSTRKRSGPGPGSSVRSGGWRRLPIATSPRSRTGRHLISRTCASSRGSRCSRS